MMDSKCTLAEPERPARLRRQSAKRRLAFEDSCESASPREKKRQQNLNYRAKLQSDPRRFVSFKKSEADRLKVYRATRTDEQRAAEREKDKLRKRALCARQRKERAISKTPEVYENSKPCTRLEKEKLDERRERNRLSQQKRRANMSSQKKRRERERNLAYYYSKKLLCSPSDSTTAEADLNTAFISTTARTSAVSRLKKKLGSGPKFFLSLRSLIKSYSRKNPTELEKVGVHYLSPSKLKPPKRKASDDISVDPVVLKAIYKRRSKSALQMRSFMITVGKVLKKYDSSFLRQHGLKKKRAEAPYTRMASQNDKLVDEFFNRKAIQLPGKRFVSKKTGTSKKILDTSVTNLFREFVEEHGSLLAKATFFRKKPKDILSFTKTPLRQCLCEVCMNPLLKLRSVKPFIDVVDNVRDLIKLIVCSLDKMECIKGHCSNCGGQTFLNSFVDRLIMMSNGQNVDWWRWERCNKKGVTRVDLVEKSGTMRELGEELKFDCKSLPLHYFTQEWQSKQFSQLIKNIPKGHAVLILDFAENYLCRLQDQPQSAYFGYSQVTVHPCVLYTVCMCGQRKTNNIVFFSDVLQHSANMVKFILLEVFRLIEEVGDTSKVVIFSDGCSSQYKSKLPFHHLATFQVSFKIERCFFGARHGKNPCDALGGLVKQTASCAVQARQVVIKDASDLTKFSKKALAIRRTGNACTHVQRSFHLIEESDIETTLSSNFKTISGTRTFHSLKPESGSLFARNLSCFCPPCMSADFSSCINKEFVEDWRLVSSSKAVSSSTCLAQRMNRSDFFHYVMNQFVGCKSYSELQNVVGLVRSSLKVYPLPSSVPLCICDCSEQVIDSVALSLVPTFVEHLYPALTVGDGNCMPRALSYLMFGSQEHHQEIRCRMTIELVTNSADYLSLPVGDLAFISALSDEHSSDIVQTFQREVLNTSQSSTYLGMWHLMAAANALSIPIQSVYPSKGQMCNISFFNRILEPRNKLIDHIFTVLWSSCREDMPESYWVANHIVPLLALSVPPETVGVEG